MALNYEQCVKVSKSIIVLIIIPNERYLYDNENFELEIVNNNG